MPAVSLTIAAPPERVFEVLSQPESYPRWEVGSRSVESADEDFPAPGSAFAHTHGKWPLILADETEVVASDPPRRLELLVRVRPLLVARVVLTLERTVGGTRVTMEERPLRGLLAPFIRLPGGGTTMRLRNLEGLRRLRRLAETR
jgi:uncharacterized protein YndB with AHSA1/START domain